jgi:two-component system sensor histidine kinase PhoQ
VRTLSLNARLLMAASIVLMAFLGLTGLALDRAFQDTALVSVQERLQAQIYMLLGAAELDDDGILVLPETLPEIRLSTPGSGLYAWVAFDDRPVWRSLSLLGQSLPSVSVSPGPGGTHFEELATADGSGLFALGFTVSWETAPDRYRLYTVWVAESRQGFSAQVGKFRRSLWVWFLAAALVLLLVQGLILRWSLLPLRRVAQEVVEIEAGRRSELAGRYPQELRPLTGNLNAFIGESRTRLERSRNALGDLAHSLKTPLAVLRGAIENQMSPQELMQTVQEQVGRMNQTVEYQLQRAAASGRITMAAPVPVAPLAQKIVDSLAKVYAPKHLQVECRIDKTLVFHGDQGDLMEIIGNLADNACKWARRRVRVQAYTDVGLESDFVLEVDDDGPGIPAEKRRVILARGERADPATVGHGIGLAVVRNLVEDVYRGVLAIDASTLGGTQVQVRLQT